MANNYDVNYDDERFGKVESDKQQAMTELEQTYGGMINESDKYFQAQIDASKQWADKQTQIQNEQTDFTIEQINQQKDQAKQDYTKEQSGAYVDWQKQSNQYGANAEKMAAQGMTGTGYSESSQVSMYNTYQNRVATARESFVRATLNYDNAIKEARLQNSSALAQIAHEAYVQQLELSLQGFQYKNNLILEQANKKMEVEQIYHNRWQDVLQQINHENAFKYQQDRDKVADQQWKQEHALKITQFKESIRQFNEEIARLKAKDAKEHALEIKRLEQQKALAEKQLAEEKRQFNILHSSSGSGGTISKGSSGGSSSGSSKKSSSSKKVTTPIDKADQWKKTKKTKSNNSGGGVDMDSVLSLGYGPISASRAYELVKQGLAETYTKNGKTYFRKSSKAFKLGQLFKG